MVVHPYAKCYFSNPVSFESKIIWLLLLLFFFFFFNLIEDDHVPSSCLTLKSEERI